jgi:predicted small secreted protein
VTWKQFQLGIGACFTANVVITLLVAIAFARSQNTNTNIINDPRAELRQSLRDEAWEKLKEQESARSVRN